jgi:PAS domain S-box-containing protein
MNLAHLLSVGLISAGCVFIAWAIFTARTLSGSLAPESPATWRGITRLMYFFLGVYLLFIFLLLPVITIPGHVSDLLSGIVFFTGAIFVFLVIRATGRILLRMQSQQSDLRAAGSQLHQKNVALEQEIEVRRQVEKKLHEAQVEWQNTFDTIDEAITVHDMDYNILLSNKFARDLFGEKNLPLDGKKCYTVYHDTDTPPSYCPSCQVYRSRLPSSSELFEPTLGRHLHVKALPRLNEDGEMQGIVHVVRDITALKDAEHREEHLHSQLVKAQRMESVGRLAGGIAHDFNNLLTVIVSFADVIARKLDPKSELIAPVNQIISSSERASHLTRGLLAFSRRQVFNLRTVDINDILRGIERVLAGVVREDIDFKLQLCDGPLTVHADVGQIEQVIMNLTTNANDAMPDGGSLRIESGVFTMDEDFLRTYDFGAAGEYALFTVTDSGTGMDRDTQRNIFEPFFTTKETGKGTGLGLSIAYGIVKQHNGFLRVESAPGKGTTLHVYLPLTKEAKPAGEEKTSDIPRRRGSETILLAEDSAEVREAIGIILNEAGYRTVPASDGEDALRKFFAHREEINLVILDVVMPKMSGKAVFDQIRETHPGTKVLFMSGYAEEIITRKGIAAEFDYLEKPAKPSQLLAKVREMLDRP